MYIARTVIRCLVIDQGLTDAAGVAGVPVQLRDGVTEGRTEDIG